MGVFYYYLFFQDQFVHLVGINNLWWNEKTGGEVARKPFAANSRAKRGLGANCQAFTVPPPDDSALVTCTKTCSDLSHGGGFLPIGKANGPGAPPAPGLPPTGRAGTGGGWGRAGPGRGAAASPRFSGTFSPLPLCSQVLGSARRPIAGEDG